MAIVWPEARRAALASSSAPHQDEKQAMIRNGSCSARRRSVAAMCAAAVLVLAGMPVELFAQRPAAAAASAFSETDVKAALLYNFGSYVQWPADAAADDPITFAVLNAPAIEQALERLVDGRTLQNRPVRVRRLRSINALDGADVVFIGATENWRLPQLIASIGGPTLVVTDAPNGLSAGSMINFQLIDQRVRFEVALPAAEAAGLMLSSRLLSAALRVETSRCWIECRHGADAYMLLSSIAPRLPSFSPTRRVVKISSRS